MNDGGQGGGEIVFRDQCGKGEEETLLMKSLVVNQRKKGATGKKQSISRGKWRG